MVQNMSNLTDTHLSAHQRVFSQHRRKELAARRIAASIATQHDDKAFITEYESVFEFGEPTSLTNLPIDVMEKIIERLAKIESYFHGPTATARDLCNVSSMSREWRIVAKRSFQFIPLTSYRNTVSSRRRTRFADWSLLLKYPSDIKRSPLKRAALSRCLSSSGSKANLAVRILASLNINVPCRPSVYQCPDVLYAIVKERTQCYHIPNVYSTLSDAHYGKLGPEWRTMMTEKFHWTKLRCSLNWTVIKAYLFKEFGTLANFNHKADIARLNRDVNHDRRFKERLVFDEFHGSGFTIEDAEHEWTQASDHEDTEHLEKFKTVCEKEQSIVFTSKQLGKHVPGALSNFVLHADADKYVDNMRMHVPEVFVIPQLTMEAAKRKWIEASDHQDAKNLRMYETSAWRHCSDSTIVNCMCGQKCDLHCANRKCAVCCKAGTMPCIRHFMNGYLVDLPV